MMFYLVPDLPRLADLASRIDQIDKTRRYTNGGLQLGEFERRAALMLDPSGVAKVCGMSSGTAALEVALMALDLPRGARILTPALTFPATALAVMRAGLSPVFGDVEADTWSMSPRLARQAAASLGVSAVIPVSTFGRPQPAADWGDFAEQTGLPVLIDAAAAFGSQDMDPRIMAAFSLHATKPLGVGEGGLLAVADDALGDRVRRLINFGFVGGVSTAVGTNAKLNEYAAAIGLAQLDRWAGLRAKRQNLLASYAAAFASSDVALQAGLGDHAPAALVVSLPVSNLDVGRKLALAEIETRRTYLPALHQHPVFSGVARSDLSTTDALADRLLALPFHTFMDEHDCRRVADAVLRSAECP